MNCGINGSIAAHNSLLILRVPMFQGYSDHGLITIATVWFLPCRRHFGDQVRRLRGAQLVSDGPGQQFVDAVDRILAAINQAASTKPGTVQCRYISNISIRLAGLPRA